MNLKEKMQAVPIIKHPVLYLAIVLSFLILSITPILSNIPNGELLLMMCYGAMLIFTVTIGFKDFGPFYNNRGNFFNLMKQTINIWICLWISSVLVLPFLATNDPQQLGQYSFPFSWSFVVNTAAKCLFIGIGEEIFKVCLFFLFYWALAKRSKNHVISCVISVFITSFIFGLLHIGYNPLEWLGIAMLIGGHTVVYFYFLLKYQTIIPLMLAHALQDFLAVMKLTEGINVQDILSCIMLISFIVLTIKNLVKRKSYHPCEM